jgi:hypothetical protein
MVEWIKPENLHKRKPFIGLRRAIGRKFFHVAFHALEG